jgi:hypothetical protein
MTSTKSLILFGLAAALLSTACFVGGEDVPLAGSWESHEPIGGYRNTLDIDEDLRGAATVYFYLGNDDPTLYYADYIVAATTLGTSDNYLVSMVCLGTECSDLDFTMTCGVIDGEYLDCIGSDSFADYDGLAFTRPYDY